MLARSDTAKQRDRLYAGFKRRNRLVGLLRWAVPVGAGLALMAPLTAALIGSFGMDFSIGRISIERDALVVESPQYSGVAADGSTYKVTAASARAALGEIDIIILTDARLRLLRPDGVEMRVDAAEARLNTTSQVIEVTGIARVGDSTGSSGTLEASRFDWPAMELTANGPVAFVFGDGTDLRAQGLHYRLNERKWEFVTATLVTASDVEMSEP